MGATKDHGRNTEERTTSGQGNEPDPMSDDDATNTDTTDGTGSNDADTTDGGNGDDGAKFTQADLDAHIGKAKGAAKSATKREVAELLGMSLEEAQKLLTEQAETKKASMDEAERAKLEAEEIRQKAETAMAEAARATTEANVRSALLSGETPIRGDRLDLAVTLALPVASSDDHEDPIAAAVAFVTESSPEWFGTGSEEDDDTDDKSTGTGSKTPPAPARKNGERNKRNPDAAARAKDMFERNRSNSSRSPMSPNNS